jgi:hypothetical protein
VSLYVHTNTQTYIYLFIYIQYVYKIQTFEVAVLSIYRSIRLSSKSKLLNTIGSLFYFCSFTWLFFYKYRGLILPKIFRTIF